MPKLGMEAIRRRQVMDAVIHILSTQGWRDLTIREVSDVAGISSGVVTHYFSNKRALTLDAINDAILQYVKALGKIEHRRGAVVGRLIALIDFVSQPAPPEVPDCRFWLGLLGRMPFDRVLQAEVQKVHRLYAEIVARLIEAGIEEREFQPDRTPGDIAVKFVSAAVGMSALMVADPQDMPPERCRRLLLDLLGQDLGVTLEEMPAARAQLASKLA
ncbi:TetR family transcriptional regulator [Bradyrhizobium jicamae]|uniref:TetR family transcriptional regulator n=1 Tax=Bradyrhizobium jicamae TaxID=280332 RepID=UPI001BA5ED88|nr:TetR family transcriptional regulator [Bradyrhizobium jicamae]MBR0934138.1 TetR family transcriptional regulator C-terminal domain-containing protein [Bradyrhizobium jicamae]